MARFVLRYAYAPLFFASLLGAAIVVSEGGTRPVVLGALLVLAIAVSFVAERILPYERAFNEPRGDRWRDVAHALVNEASNTFSILTLPVAAAVFPIRDLAICVAANPAGPACDNRCRSRNYPRSLRKSSVAATLEVPRGSPLRPADVRVQRSHEAPAPPGL